MEVMASSLVSKREPDGALSESHFCDGVPQKFLNPGDFFDHRPPSMPLNSEHIPGLKRQSQPLARTAQSLELDTLKLVVLT